MIVNMETMKELRLEMGLTQGKMAEKLGVSRQFYNKVENGNKPISESMKLAIEKIAEEKEKAEKDYSDRFKEQKASQVARLRVAEEQKEYINNVTTNRKMRVFCPSIEPSIDKIWITSMLTSSQDKYFRKYMQGLLSDLTELGVILVTNDGNGVKNGKYQWLIEGEDGKIFVEYGFLIKGENGLQRKLRVSYNPNKVGFDNRYLIKLMEYLGHDPVIRKFDVCKDFYGISLKHLITSHNAFRDSKLYVSKGGYRTYYFGDMNANGTRVYDKRGEKIEQDNHDIGYDCTRIETRVTLRKSAPLSCLISEVPNIAYPVLVGINGELTKASIGEDVDMNTFCNLKCILDGVLTVGEFDKNKRARLRKLLDGMATTTITLCETDVKIALLKYIEDYDFAYGSNYGYVNEFCF